MIKVAVITLGCAKNQVDSEYMEGVLENSGDFKIVNDPEQAMAVVINTCSFITAAKREALETIMGLVKLKTRPYIIVAGCLVQHHAQELWRELPEAAAFISPGAIKRLPSIVKRVIAGERFLDAPLNSGQEEVLPRRFHRRPYAYLKIAEGCNNKCSFCTIPTIKGPYHSRPLENIVAEAGQLVGRGVKELILVAQDTTAYGLDYYGQYRLPQLLRQLVKLSGLEWLRLLYTYPTRITPELIEVMATEAKVVPYLDLPLQHASGSILKSMQRAGDAKTAIRTIEKLRRAIPEIALRSTFIVGYPGEKEHDFKELLDFMSFIKFDWVGAFKYSPEEGTAAAQLPNQVADRLKRERYRRLMLHQQPITRACNQYWVGKKMKVLMEEPTIGRSFRQAPEVDGLIYPRNGNLSPGSMVDLKILEVYGEYDLIAES